ncbi:MAG: NAD(P)-dependent oxidoreductase [Armatimonadota bacterium]|nr:NAD(P)-dependent oxidoreductase [Armatimonadota bacterium]
MTGVAGLIGSRLAHRLVDNGVSVRGMDVVPPAAARVTFIPRDLREPRGLSAALAGARAVIHCARWAGIPPSRAAAEAVEVEGTANLLAACLDAGVERVVCMSSVAVYGPTRTPLITEDTPRRPADFYGRIKRRVEEAAAGAGARGLAVTVVRAGLVYGPRATGGTVHPVRRILAGRPVLASGGRGYAHPVYIDNLIDAVLAASSAADAVGQAINVVDGDVTWREFFGHYARMCRRPLRSAPAAAVWLVGLASEMAAALLRRPLPAARSLAHFTTRRTRVSTVRAREILGWAPRYSLAEAMAETERWLRDARIVPD